MVKVVNAVRFWHFDDSMPAIREANLWQTGDTNTIPLQGLDGEGLRSFVAKSAEIPAGNNHHFSSHKNCDGLLIYHWSCPQKTGASDTHAADVLALFVILLFMLLIEEDTLGFDCLPQIFHWRIDRATLGRQLPEQTPPGFSLKHL